MDLSVVAVQWLAEQRAKGAARATQNLYAHVSVSFTGFLSHLLERSPTVADFTTEHARAYVIWLEEVPFTTGKQRRFHSPQTIAEYAQVLKVWSAFLTAEGAFPQGDPLARFRVPRVPENEPPVLNKEQIRLLLRLCDGTRLGLRNKAIIWLLADSGMRVGELVRVRVDEVLYATAKGAGVIQIHAKTAKSRRSRQVFFDLRCSRAIAKYVDEGRPESRDPQLFLTQSGAPLSVDAVRRMMKVLARQAGITGIRVTPHTLRHSFATQSLREGLSVLHVQMMLGHSRVATTQRYVHLANADLHDSYRSPW